MYRNSFAVKLDREREKVREHEEQEKKRWKDTDKRR